MIITNKVKRKPDLENGDLIRYEDELYIVGFIDKTKEGDFQPLTIHCLIKPDNCEIIECDDFTFYTDIQDRAEIITRADKLRLSWE